MRKWDDTSCTLNQNHQLGPSAPPHQTNSSINEGSSTDLDLAASMEALQLSTRAARDRRRRSTSPDRADPDEQDRVGQRRRMDSGAVADQPRSPAPRLPSPTTVALAAGSTSTPPAAGTGGFAGSGAGLGAPSNASASDSERSRRSPFTTSSYRARRRGASRWDQPSSGGNGVRNASAGGSPHGGQSSHVQGVQGAASPDLYCHSPGLLPAAPLDPAHVITSPPLLRRLGASDEFIRCVEQGRYQDVAQEAARLRSQASATQFVPLRGMGDGLMPSSHPQAQAGGSTTQAQAPASKAPHFK